METIKHIWFENDRIYMLSNLDKVYSRPLEAFPLLKDAPESVRLDFFIEMKGTAVRWPAIDEDIHISSFYKTDEPDENNEIARIFRAFPQLNVSEVARSIGINKSLLAKYIYGIKKPSPQRILQIKSALSLLASRLADALS